jgi:hypothetical protein
MTSRPGRLHPLLDENVVLRRPLDENVGLQHPLDDQSGISATGAGRRRIGRASVVVGVIVCGLLGPATARAADPFGAASVVQQLDAAVATAPLQQLDAATSAATGALSSQASNPAAVAPVESAATKTLEVATKQAAAIASTAAADTKRDIQATAPASPSASRQAARTGNADRLRHHARRARRSASPLRVPSTVPTSTENRVAPVPTMSWTSASAKRAESRRGPGARATPESRAGPTPQRFPPSPLPPGPGGSALSGQGGVHGPMTPLLIGALAAALLMLAFEFLPRALPLRAFRKPGHVPLPPWHPG